jgi:leucyl-tRNA synthetase
MAPYLGEEFWRELGHRESIHLEAWPKFDPE